MFTGNHPGRLLFGGASGSKLDREYKAIHAHFDVNLIFLACSQTDLGERVVGELEPFLQEIRPSWVVIARLANHWTLGTLRVRPFAPYTP